MTVGVAALDGARVGVETGVAIVVVVAVIAGGGLVTRDTADTKESVDEVGEEVEVTGAGAVVVVVVVAVVEDPLDVSESPVWSGWLRHRRTAETEGSLGEGGRRSWL